MTTEDIITNTYIAEDKNPKQTIEEFNELLDDMDYKINNGKSRKMLNDMKHQRDKLAEEFNLCPDCVNDTKLRKEYNVLMDDMDKIQEPYSVRYCPFCGWVEK